MKKSISIIDTLLLAYKSIKYVVEIKKTYIIVVFIYELIKVVKVFPYMFLLKHAVSFLVSKCDFIRYLHLVLMLLTLIFVLEIFTTILSNIKERGKTHLDILVQEKIIEKNDCTDYYTLSTQNYAFSQSKALQAYNEGCLVNNISYVFSLISTIIVILGITVTISSLGVLVIIPVVISVFVRIISEYFDRNAHYIRSTEIAKVNKKSNYIHKVCEDITYAKEIRIFNLCDFLNKKNDVISNHKIASWKKYMGIFRKSSSAYDFADVALQFFLYIVLAYRVLISQSLALSDFVYCFTACQQLQATVGNAASNLMNIFLNSAYLKDFMDYWETSSFNSKDNDTKVIQSIGITDGITVEFCNVSFKYPNSNCFALKDVNIKLNSGKTYLIVGKNGAGKSTFIKLLCRLYTPSSGVITLNGIDIQKYNIEEYLSIISVLFQDYAPLNLSIIENICSLSTTASSDRFSNALRHVNLKGIIDGLAKQEFTSYGKLLDPQGVQFSGGEEQQMMLAKTLYKSAPIQIFDEPTSKVDVFTEEKILRTLEKESSDHLNIYITHRVASSLVFDNIIAFDNGRIVETGTHSELMEKNGVYAHLFLSQANMYMENYQYGQT